MDTLTTQALDIVFQSEGVQGIKKKAKPYVAGVLFFHLLLLFMLAWLIFKVEKLGQFAQVG